MPEYDFITMMTAPPEGAICDFCSSPDIHWTYPCRDHRQKPERAEALVLKTDGSLDVVKAVIDGFASGGWTACNPCHALIERGDRVRLARRSAKRIPRGTPMPLSNAIAHVRRLQDQFWENREGAPIHHEHRPTKDPTR